jgi:hypothetical protein
LALFVLVFFLNILLEITIALLNFADILLDIAFNLHSFVVQYHASGFLDFTCGFIDSSFYLILVDRGCLLAFFGNSAKRAECQNDNRQ